MFAQQLKVFAKQGEFINVGASHVGLKGGFIKVYAPSGALVATFDDANGPGVLDNNVEEDGGPTGRNPFGNWLQKGSIVQLKKVYIQSTFLIQILYIVLILKLSIIWMLVNLGLEQISLQPSEE